MEERLTFHKPFTQQEGLPEEAIQRAVELMRSGRLHRYNTMEGEVAEAALLEKEFAEYQGSSFCVACTSGGYAMQIALRACGLKPGEHVLTNAYTLAPVPGAIHACGGVPVLVEIDNDWHIDLADLETQAKLSKARFLLLSHMRGHIADMEKIVDICDRLNITLIEDCAHTMGARWKGQRSGSFGTVACFSTQTYKHMNSGEGGFITTDDSEVAARATVMSGSYMLYERHIAAPLDGSFDTVKLDSPNMSGRMDNLRAALLRPQVKLLPENIERWNLRYRVLEKGLQQSKSLFVPEREPYETYVGSSIQFQMMREPDDGIPGFLVRCGRRGVDLKWFGWPEPYGFTSRYDSWKYLGEQKKLPSTDAILARTCDLRIPLTFDLEDCETIASIIVEEAAA